MTFSRRLNYLRRLIGTAVGFISFGLGGLAFGVLVIPWIWLRHRHNQQRGFALRHAISRSFRLHTNVLRVFGVLECRLHNSQRLRGGQLIIANHPSLLDIVFLVGFVENAVCVVKDALFHNPWVGFVIRVANYVSNVDPENMISACQAALERGESVIIFPEGTRSVPGRAPQLQRGAAYVALYAQQPLIPVKIHCVPSTLTKAQPWYDIPPQKIQYDFVVGEPLDVSQHRNKPRTLAARCVNEEIRQLLFCS